MFGYSFGYGYDPFEYRFLDFKNSFIRVLQKMDRVRVWSSQIRMGSDFNRNNQTTRFDSGYYI